jgi:hypothetical protein
MNADGRCLGTGRKNLAGPAVLRSEMPHYDEARLVRLLRLLRVPPLEWVRRAQRIPLGSASLTEEDLQALAAKLDRDPSFRKEFDADPVVAVRDAGMRELGSRLEYEIGELVALAERVARDADRREELVGALAAEDTGAGSLFRVLVASDVEAHVSQMRPLEERALLLALTSTAVADELRAAVDRA